MEGRGGQASPMMLADPGVSVAESPELLCSQFNHTSLSFSIAGSRLTRNNRRGNNQALPAILLSSSCLPSSSYPFSTSCPLLLSGFIFSSDLVVFVDAHVEVSSSEKVSLSENVIPVLPAAEAAPSWSVWILAINAGV